MNRPFRPYFLLAVAIVPLLLPGRSAGAQNTDKLFSIPHITVTGQGEVKVRPDKMEVTAGVVTEDRSSQLAAASNAQASQKVQNAVRKAGVADKDIQTVNYNVSPIYSEVRLSAGAKPQPPRITGYRVYNQVRVTVRNLTKMSDVLDEATAAGSNTIEGIAPGLEDQKAAEGAALEKAVQDARRKADHMVKAAGTTLTGILEMSDTTGYGPRPMAFSRMDAAQPSTPIAAGELAITANVTITYSLDGKRF